MHSPAENVKDDGKGTLEREALGPQAIKTTNWPEFPQALVIPT